MRIVSDKFLEDLREVLIFADIPHFDDCTEPRTGGSENCNCGADVTTQKLKKLRAAIHKNSSFSYSGAMH